MLKLGNNFTAKETRLLDALGVTHPMRNGISPLRVYEAAAVKAFRDNTQGPAADSLRRCLNYLEDAAHFRGNDEFDSLIQL